MYWQLLMLTPLDPFGLDDGISKQPNRFAQINLVQPKEVQVEFDWAQTRSTPSSSGGAHEEKAGKLGKPDLPSEQAAASRPGAPLIDPNKRERDREIVSSSGIFSVLQGMKQIETSSVFGPGGVGTGLNNALGGIEGTNPGDTAGAGGLGTRGTGPGGGGDSMGIGGLGNGSGIGPGGDDMKPLPSPARDVFKLNPNVLSLRVA